MINHSSGAKNNTQGHLCMPKKKPPIEDQYGAYEYTEEDVSPKGKKKFRMSAGVGDGPYPKYEKVEAEEVEEASGYPRLVKNSGGGTFATNYVSTTKYSRWSFLPMATLEQYKRGANVYLLFIAVLCCIPAISPLMPIAAVMPVVFVLSISLIREGMEDLARYRADEELNNKTCEVRNPSTGDFAEVMWKDVCVGDLIKLYDRDWIPADVCLLTSSAEDGSAFIDTMDLDGETNLKRRSSPKCTTGMALEESGALAEGELKCVGPNGDLYSFDGALNMNGGQAAASEQQLLLRSSRLRNTKWAVGIVVYTGQESKVMLNSRSGGSKQSALEAIVNKAILAIFMVQLCMAIVSSVLAGMWASANCPGHSYLACSANGPAFGFLTFWTYIILLNSLIPASLIVTMEIVKVAHASYIDWDHELCKSYDKKENKWRRGEAHTSALNEGLGQIDYIFSDKTGTLTENRMVLMKVTVDSDAYGAESGEKMAVSEAESGKLQMAPCGSGAPDEQKAALTAWSSGWVFNRMLAVCQTVLIEVDEETQEISYNADSPDEVALVLGGKAFGCEFTGRKNGDVSQVDFYPSGKPGEGKCVKEEWRVLNQVAFSSKRKRMTVIVQRVVPPPDNPDEVQIWMKGADNVIMDRVEKVKVDASTKKQLANYDRHLEYYSMDGLRTLCFAQKTLKLSEQETWSAKWEAATLLPPAEREVKFETLASEVEDGGFGLVGCTAVEDKLQANVPETIVRLARANIKLWVLTGDKQETAIEIGRSTNLLTPSMKLHVLNSTSEDDVNAKLAECLQEAAGMSEDDKQGLVVDGATLNFILEGDPSGKLILKEAADKFVELATQCRSVVVCRSSPLQKALIVLLVKKFVPGCRALGVGDGANDVPMIRAANIGIGIAGLEGMQAARAADYAIQEFQDLDRLLLHHGRLSYFRVSNMCTYFFYKSWSFTLPQWLFGFYCGYSGISFYESLYVPSFNMFFTSMPVFARAVLDQDLDLTKAGPLLPELYHVAIEDKLFNTKVLCADLFLSFLHAGLCFWAPQYTFSADDMDLWQMSLATYSLVVFVSTARIAVHTRAWSIPIVLAYAASIGVYFMWQFAYDAMGSLVIRGVAPELNGQNIKFSFLCVLVVGLVVVSEIFMRFFLDNMKPSNVDVVRSAKAEDIAAEGQTRSDAASAAQIG